MDSCGELFKIMENLHFFLLLYVVKKKLFPKNSAVHNNDIISANNFHLNFTNLTKYQKGPHYSVIKIFKLLPIHINCVANYIQIVKSPLKGFLFSNSFCSFERYFNFNK
jgi:hypothetical protein